MATPLLWDPSATTYHSLKLPLLAIGALFALLASILIRTAPNEDPARSSAPWLLAILLWTALGTSWSPSLPSAFDSIFLLSCGLALLVATARMTSAIPRSAWVMALLAATSGAILTLHGLLQWAIHHSEPSGLLGNPNHLAAYVAATTPLTVAVAHRIWKRWRRNSAAGLAILVIASSLVVASFGLVLVTGCRAAMAGLTLAMAVLVLPRRRPLIAVGALAALLIVALAIVPKHWKSGFVSRRYLASISLRIFAQHPIRGQGPGSYALLFPEAQATFLETHHSRRGLWTNARHAHCEPIELLTDGGLIVALFLAAWLVTFLVRRFSARRRQKAHGRWSNSPDEAPAQNESSPPEGTSSTPPDSASSAPPDSAPSTPPGPTVSQPDPDWTSCTNGPLLANAIWSALLVLLVAGLAEATLHQPAHLALAALLAGTLAGLDAAHRKEPTRPVAQHHQPLPAKTGLHVRMALQNRVLDAVLLFTVAAAGIWYGRQELADRLLGQALGESRPTRQVPILRRADRMATNPGRIRFYLGLALLHSGQPEQALVHLGRAVADYPNPAAFLAMGNALFDMTRYAEAARVFRHVTWLHPRFAAAYHNLSVTLNRLGRHEEARRAQRRARSIWPARWRSNNASLAGP
ncbi:MAG: O-antigen ligase family protein [Deltaproteobacteria bacterium]|nr:O-antigen ligase family protein [Deltaproteobacteria bacterium]